MSGTVGTLTSADHVTAALAYEANLDWSNAAAEWQAAIDTLNPAMGSANAATIATYQANIVNDIAQSRIYTASGA